MKPIFFSNQAAFRNWLMKNHTKEIELWVGFFKKNSGRPNMTWSQSVDEALCFGWIDGVRRSIDRESYCIRFTQRRPSSLWSALNIRKVEELTEKGLMQPDGITAFKKRKESKPHTLSFETETKLLPQQFELKFKTNKTAWDFFIRQAPSYRRTILRWVMTAKQEPTREKRLEKLIKESENQNRIF